VAGHVPRIVAAIATASVPTSAAVIIASAAGTAAPVGACTPLRAATRVPTPTASSTTAAVTSHGTASRRPVANSVAMALDDRGDDHDVAVDADEHRRREHAEEPAIRAAGRARRVDEPPRGHRRDQRQRRHDPDRRADHELARGHDDQRTVDRRRVHQQRRP